MNNPGSSRNRSQSGMTLIEVLVVVAVIGVLVALIYPALKAGVGSANRVKCLGNLRQIGVAAELYTQEHNNRFPDINAWAMELCPYFSFKISIENLPTHTKTIFWCPSANPAQVDPSPNGTLTYGIGMGYAGMNRIAQLSNNGQPVVLSKLAAFFDASGKNVWDTTPERVSVRHGACYNVLFADGHAESLQNQQYAPGSYAWLNLLYGYTRY